MNMTLATGYRRALSTPARPSGSYADVHDCLVIAVPTLRKPRTVPTGGAAEATN